MAAAILRRFSATHEFLAKVKFSGVTLEGITPEDFTDCNSFFRFWLEPKGFDILPAIPGVILTRMGETVIERLPA